MIPDKGPLFNWASYIAVALFILRALYAELRKLIILIASDLQRLSPGQLNVATWLTAIVLIVFAILGH